jgi:branched-chain amino acid transport system substrate-binding protein
MKTSLLKLISLLTLVSILATACGGYVFKTFGVGDVNNLPVDITLGAVHDLSGPVSLYGISIRNGIDLAVKQINAQAFLGEGRTLKVVYEDPAGDPQKAVSAFEKLIANPDIVAILGPTLSGEAKLADPLAQEAGMPVIASSNTVAGITEMGDFIFRTSLPESAVIPNTIKTAKAAFGLTKVAVIYENDDTFTQSSYEVFKSALASEGIEILVEETFSKGATDFSTQLAEIKSVNPDAIIISAYPEEAAQIMIQARASGIPDTVHFIGGNTFNSQKLVELTGEAAEGAISGSAWNENSTFPASIDFVNAFTAAYGSAPDQFAAQAYTAAWVTAIAIKNANSVDHSAVRDALAKIKDFDSPLGAFSFDVHRDPVHESVVLIVKNGVLGVFQP